MKPLLRHLDGLLRITGDENVVWIPAMRIGRAITVHLREGRREVDGSPGGRLDQLDVLPVPATDDLVKRQFELDDIDDSTELFTQKSINVHLAEQ